MNIGEDKHISAIGTCVLRDIIGIVEYKRNVRGGDRSKRICGR